ncbi:MAG: YitT family protein [Chlamydiales bacterium]|nr:YitT family protein [Chlamydiales bacterium]
MKEETKVIKSPLQFGLSFIGLFCGALLGAFAIRVFFLPNNLIDGGIVGISLIFGRLFGDYLVSIFLIVFNLPFIYLAYKHLRKTFVIQMAIAIVLFAGFLSLCEGLAPFNGDSLEIIVIGGALLGIAAGLIIRFGGCTDGSEILAILINRKFGFTVGQVILFINVFVFGAYGFIFLDWHIALKSLMAYIVAVKMMDLVITGLDELKSVTIITNNPKILSEAITKELGLGLTVMYGRGGYSGEEREILFVIVERLDLADLKELVQRKDPTAFVAIENLHEVVYGKSTRPRPKKKRLKLTH